MYRNERQRGSRPPCKRLVATATSNVRLVCGADHQAKERGPGFLRNQHAPDLSRPEVRPTESCGRYQQACSEIPRRFLRQVIEGFISSQSPAAGGASFWAVLRKSLFAISGAHSCQSHLPHARDTRSALWPIGSEPADCERLCLKDLYSHVEVADWKTISSAHG